MATSHSPTTQYAATHFVESAGAILFKQSTRQVCLIHHLEKGEWLLAKGRRNCGESRHEAAVRELQEETGFSCRLLKVNLSSRAPPAVEEGQTPDIPRLHTGVTTEPFMLTVRQTAERSVKVIWWYIAAMEEGAEAKVGESEQAFAVELCSWEEALARLTYHTDREVLQKAIKIHDETYGVDKGST